MANKQTRDPGAILMPTIQGRTSTAVPSFAVDKGDAWRALAIEGDALSNKLRGMVVAAVQREGDLAGLSAGQRAGSGYLARRDVEAQAVARSVNLDPDIDASIVAAAEKHGVDPNTLRMFASIESSGNPNAKNPTSSAGGLFQFIDKTAAQYGLKNRFDVAEASDAAARLTRDNAASLRRALGREPTPAELYLAHQQGAGGAAELLTNPNALARDIVGKNAVTLNGGSADMTAGDFAQKWLRKAAGNLPATTKVAEAARPQNPLSETPLQLRRDGTVRGDAFDAAATRAYSWRVQSALTADLNQAFEDNRDNPAGYSQAAGNIRSKYLEDQSFNDPHLREAFDKSFAERTASDRTSILANHERRLRGEEQAAATEGLDGLHSELERSAYNLGANGDADTLLTPQIARALGAIDNAVAEDLLSPAQGAARKKALGETIAQARIQGTFQAIESPAAQEEFANSLLEEWSSGKGPIAELTFAQARALSATLFAQARGRGNQMKAEARAESHQLAGYIRDDIASIAATGMGVVVDGQPLDPVRVESLLGPDAAVAWQSERENARHLYEATNGMETDTAAEIADRLQLLTPAEGQPGFAEQQAIQQAAAKRAQEILKERETDPLGQAMRAHAIDLKPIAFESPDALAASLEQRKVDADSVAGMMEIAPVYFRQSERTALANALLEKPDLLPQFAMSVSETFGEDAPRVLAEISPAGPAIAHAAALGIQTNDLSIATDIARVLSARQSGDYKIKMPTDSKFSEVAASAIGPALALSPGTQSAAVQVAQLLFERDAQLRGFDPTDLDVEGSSAHESYRAAVNRALGGSVVDGKAYGGIGEVNGAPTIVPADMPSDQVGQLVRSISAEDMDAIGPLSSSNGVEITPQQLRSARLVAVSDGKYLMALGDPQSADPQYVPGDGPGGFFVLDIRALAESRSGSWRVEMGGFGIGSVMRGR